MVGLALRIFWVQLVCCMLDKFSHLTVSVTRHSTFAGCDGQINESQLILDRLKLLFVPTVVSVINVLAVPAVLHFLGH